MSKAVLGNFGGPLRVVWKYGTANDWMVWRQVNKTFRDVSDKACLKQWICYLIYIYIPAICEIPKSVVVAAGTCPIEPDVNYYTGLIKTASTVQIAWIKTKVLRNILKMRQNTASRRAAEDAAHERNKRAYDWLRSRPGTMPFPFTSNANYFDSLPNEIKASILKSLKP
jgi:hypothetical protein